MALHTLQIVVVDGGKARSGTASGSGNKKGSSSKKENAKNSKLYKVLHLEDGIKDKIESKVSPAAFYALETGASIAISTIKQAANYYLSDIGRKHGDSNYQAQINRTLEVVGDVTSALGGAYGGAAAGSMFGPIGMLVGGLLGAAGSAISTGFKYAERERAYQHEMFKEDTSQAYNLARSNYSAVTGRVR